jgi:hypothetical protein
MNINSKCNFDTIKQKMEFLEKITATNLEAYLTPVRIKRFNFNNK